MKPFLEKIGRMNLKSKKREKIIGWYLDEVVELRWALRIALDRYDMADLDKAEAILAKYDEFIL
jgi:hypothetical protein